jgi:hypothetical protein
MFFIGSSPSNLKGVLQKRIYTLASQRVWVYHVAHT